LYTKLTINPKMNVEWMTGRRRLIKTLLMQNMTSAHIFCIA
jgi:hypothetical protein